MSLLNLRLTNSFPKLPRSSLLYRKLSRMNDAASLPDLSSNSKPTTVGTSIEPFKDDNSPMHQSLRVEEEEEGIFEGKNWLCWGFSVICVAAVVEGAAIFVTTV